MGDISIGQHDSRMKIATRNIILMMIGKMTSLLGAGIYTFAMGLYVLKTTGSGMGFATTLVCGSLPRMICASNCWCCSRSRQSKMACHWY